MKYKNKRCDVADEAVDDYEVNTESSGGSGWRAVKAVIAIGGIALGAAAAANAIIAMRTPQLHSTLGGVFNRYPARHGDLTYTVSGTGPPLLLLHAPCAGNSMAEWEQNFGELARHFTVYALDYLGWGLSDKPQQRYEGDDLVEQVHYFVEDVIGEPTAVIASAQSCGIALKAAQRAPQLFSNLVLVSPASTAEADDISYLRHEIAQKVLSLPIIGTAFYNFLVSRRNIGYFALRNLYFDQEKLAQSELSRFHVAAHQRGAQAGFISVLSGTLDVEWREAWSQLESPALIIWGRNAFEDGLETAPEWLALKPDADLEVFDQAKLLPHEEHPQRFNELVVEWLSRHKG